MTMTIKTAKAALADRSITITSRDGEYRVNFKPGFEETAYYTTDLEDAVMTGMAMAHARTMSLIADLNAARHRWCLK